LVITSAALDESNNHLLITGQNFLRRGEGRGRSDALIVTLDLLPLTIISATSTEIVASVSGTFPEGTYLVTVSRGNGDGESGAFAVAIYHEDGSGTGSQGPAGPAGPHGPAGAQRLTAAAGPTDPACPQRAARGGGGGGAEGGAHGVPWAPAGPKGPAVRSVPAGQKGAVVRRGVDGGRDPQGPAGPKGADGATGPQGPQGPAGNNGAEGAVG